MVKDERFRQTTEASVLREALAALRAGEQGLFETVTPDLKERLRIPLTFGDAAMLARAIHGLSLYLPYVLEVLDVTESPDGRDLMHVEGAREAREAAIALYRHTEKMAHHLNLHGE